MANLRDRGFGSSMENYNQQQEKKKRQQEERKKTEAQKGPVSTQKALSLPKVNSTANKNQQKYHSRQKTVVPGTATVQKGNRVSDRSVGTIGAGKQSAPAPASAQRIGTVGNDRAASVSPIFQPQKPLFIQDALNTRKNLNLTDRGFPSSIIDNTLPMPEKTEQQFLNSPLLVESYGNYYNYARGKRVTPGGFSHIDHAGFEEQFNNMQAESEILDLSNNTVLENLAKAEKDLEDAVRNSGTAPDSQRLLTMQAQLETALAGDPNAGKPETKAALAQYEQERNRYEHMDAEYRKSWNDFHNIYARNKATDAYKQAYETATKMLGYTSERGTQISNEYNQYRYEAKKQRESVRGQDEIEADINNIESRIKAIEDENKGLNIELQGGSVMTTALSLFPGAAAQAAEETLNAQDRINRNNEMIQELRSQEALLQEEMQYRRYLDWEKYTQLPVSVRRYGTVDKESHPTYGLVDEPFDDQASPGVSFAEFMGYEKGNIGQMLPEERERYKQIYEVHGEKKALEYLDELNKTDLNTRRRFAEQHQMQEFVSSAPWWGEAAWWLDSILLKPLSIASYAGQLVDYLDDGELTKDASYNRFSYLNTAVRQQIGEDFGNFPDSKLGEPWKKAGQIGYQTVTSILDNVYNIILTSGLGAIAGGAGNLSQSSSTLQSLKDAEELTLMVMGTEAAADQTISAMDRGLDSGQAMVLGTGAGLIEILTEKVSLDQLIDGMGNADSFWNAVKSVGAQGLVEGSEEFAGFWLDAALDNWVAQDKSEFRQKMNEYKRTHRGASEEAAFQAVWNETLLESLKEAGSGLLSGLLMSAGGIGINAGTNYVANRNAITNPDYVGSLIKSAQSLDQNSAGYQAAQDLQSKLDARERPTYRQVRNAERAIDTDVRTSTDYVQNRISDAEKYKGTEAATKAALLQEKIDRGESVSYRDVVALETATDKARATSSEYLSPLVEIGKADAENSPAYKAAVKVEQKLQSGQQVTVRESAQLEKAANESLKEAFDSGNAEVIGSYMISDNGARALTDAATILKNSTSQSDVQRGNQILQAIKDGNLDAKTAGEVFLRSQKILENTQKQRQNIRVLKPREVTADMDAYDRSAAELGVSEEEASHNKAIMQAFGVEGEYRSFENNNLSAYYDRSTGKVYINANADNPGLALIAHEVTHSFENTAAYRKLADLVFSQSKDLNADLQRITQEYADAGIDLDDEGARSELVAEFVEQHMFNDEKFINDVVSIDRSRGQKILAAIDNLLAKLGNKNAQQRQLLRNARDLWAEALQQRKTSDKAKAKIAEKRGLTLPTVEAKAAAVEKQYSISKGTETLSLSKIADEQDLRDRLTKMRVEFDQLREERNRLTQSEEYKRLIDSIVSGDDGAAEAYGAWEKSSGYGDIAKRMDKAQEQMTEGWKKLDQMIEKRMAAEERAAIKKSGLSEAEYFRKAAVKEFGYTPYFYDAGYILPNGKMLNFSGEKGRHFGGRGQDHRAIGTIYANEQGSAAMNRFMNDGNIRIMAESPGLDISNATAPTREQYATIRRFVNEVRDEEYFNLDFTDERGNNIGSIEYDGRVSADRVANDIGHFFQTGEVRQPSVGSRFRYAINKDATIEETTQQKINRAMTMQQAKDMIQRAFVLGGIKEWYDGEYRNGDEWLKGVGAEDVALIIDNEWTLQDRYINQNEDILNEEYSIEDVLEAYLAGTLTGQVKQTRARVDLSKGVAVADGRFYAPQQVQAAKEMLETASQRITNANRAEVAKARAQILLYAHNPGAAETLGLTNSELNKRLRSWSGYSARAREVSQRINQGVADAYKWTGIENSSWLYGASVTKDDIARMVNSIEGDADGYETSYIARTMLALDTHLDWSWLNIKFDTKSGVQKGYGGDKTSINGYFNGDKSLVHVNHYAPNTVAHEMGHALDYRWGTEFGQYYKYLTKDYKLISNKVDGETKAWVDHFGEFCESLWDSSSIVSEYSGKIEETFARFVDKFVEWTQNLAHGRNGAQSRSWYNDKFTQAQFVEFAKILQEKAALDAKGLTKNTIPAVDGKLSLPKTESKQYAISKSDTAYLKAVESGDMETAQRMVDEAANKAGYTVRAFHGTTEDFNIFEGGAFFTDDYWNADGYANGERVIDAYLKLEHPLIVDADGAMWNELESEYGSSTREIIADLGDEYDGVIFENIRDDWTEDPDAVEGTVYWVRNSDQAKSADPVTYDDSGKPIPLSERFNPNNPDIRYAINKDAALKAPSIDEILGKADGATQEQWDEIVRDIRMYAGDTKAARELLHMAETHGISAVEDYIRTQGMEGTSIHAIRRYFAPADQMVDDAISAKEQRVESITDALGEFFDDGTPGADSIRTEAPVKPKKTVKESASDAAKFLYRKIVDSGEAVSRLGKYTNDPHLYHIYNMARASSNAAVSMIKVGQTDIMGRNVGESLNSIFDGIRAKGDEYYGNLELYLYHMLNAERMSRENPGAVADARDELADFRRQNPEFNGMTDDEILKLAHDPISMFHEQAQLFEEIYNKYGKARSIRNKAVFGQDIPIENEYGEQIGTRRGDIEAKESERVASELREKLEQTEGFEEDVEKIYKYIDNLTRYRVDSGLISEDDYNKLRETYPHYVPVKYVIEEENAGKKSSNRTIIGKTIQSAKGSTKYVLQPLHKTLAQQTLSVVREGSKNRFGQMLLDRQGNSRGMISKIEQVKGDFDENTFDKDTAVNKDNSFIVRQDGKAYEITMNSDLYEAVKALSPTPMADNLVTRAIYNFTNTFKALATGYNPVFAVKNPIRDLQDVGLYSKDLSAFVGQYLPAWKEFATNGKYWQMYQALGGLYSSVFDYDRGELKEHGKVRKYSLDLIEAANMFVEQAPRLAEFMATVKKAEARGEVTMNDLAEALHNAADVTVNFGRSGEWGRILNRSVIPFFNPGVQGFDKMIRNVTETKGIKDWTRLTAKAALFGIVPVILNNLLYRKDREYEDIKQSDKDLYYLFPMRGGIWLRLPKGRALSIIGMAADRLIQTAQGKDADWASFISTAKHQAAPETNTYWQAFIDAHLFDPDNPGKTWYGGDIENKRMQSLAPGERYDTSTDWLSKWLGKNLNISPKKINYIIDQYSGALGDFFLPMMSQKPHGNIFENAFTIDTVFSNRLSGDFYEMFDKVTYAKNSTNATPEDQYVYKYIYSKSQDINKINKAIREIEEDENLTKKEKYILSSAEHMHRNEIMSDVLRQWKKYQNGDTDNDISRSAQEAQAQEARESKTYTFKGQDMAWDDLSGRQKKIVLAQEALDEDKNADLTGILGKKAPTQGEMYSDARAAGISNQKYLDALTAVDDANNGDSNYTNDETTAGLNQAIADGKITQSEANKLWPIISGGSPKNNPYASGKLELPAVETEASQASSEASQASSEASSYENQTYTFNGQQKSYGDLTGSQKKIVQSQDAIKDDPDADLSPIIGKGNAKNQLAKYQAARDKGISNQAYIDALKAIDDADDGNGNYNQAEAKAGLDKLVSDGTISEKEAGTLWKIITGGADKNNPFPVGAIISRPMGLRLPKIG